MELLRKGGKSNSFDNIGIAAICTKSYPGSGACDVYTCKVYTPGQCPIVCNNVAVY